MAAGIDKILYCRDKKKIPRLLVFGYPEEAPPVGGLLWSKRVSDSINELGVLDIKNISSEQSIERKLNTHEILRNILPCLMMDFSDAVRGFLTLPQIALLDSWGEPSIILWSLLRLFCPRTKIVVVFHHHEPRILPGHISKLKSRIARMAAERYNLIVEQLTCLMIRDSDMILTVSRTSASQLCSLYGLTEIDHRKKEQSEEKNVARGSGKIRIVGTGVDRLTINTNSQKDIDFFCIGRIEKLDGIEKIWLSMRKLRPNVNFFMIGRATLKEINRLQSMGINHKGEVPHQEKVDLYSRSKVFLFPSIREGFGIALGESLRLGMSAVVWRLPVFDELYSKSTIAKEGTIRLVERGNYELFAREALQALELYEKKKKIVRSQPFATTPTVSTTTSSSSAVSSDGKKAAAALSVLELAEIKQEDSVSKILQSWDDVARKVVKALSELT
ncbi:MAG: glycosyltransferase family 4 protein [Thermoproteota archaeon]|nr:glycosyltransferase family 4 protein [Thermoproteota archaeon]